MRRALEKISLEFDIFTWVILIEMKKRQPKQTKETCSEKRPSRERVCCFSVFVCVCVYDAAPYSVSHWYGCLRFPYTHVDSYMFFLASNSFRTFIFVLECSLFIQVIKCVCVCARGKGFVLNMLVGELIVCACVCMRACYRDPATVYIRTETKTISIRCDSELDRPD